MKFGKNNSGMVYLCDISEEQIKGVIEDVLGLRVEETYLAEVCKGKTMLCAGVSWANGVINMIAEPGEGFRIYGHASSDEVVMMEKIHPVIECYLQKEKIEYEVKCKPTLTTLLKDY